VVSAADPLRSLISVFYIYNFLLINTDAVTSKNIDSSSWDTCISVKMNIYCKNVLRKSVVDVIIMQDILLFYSRYKARSIWGAEFALNHVQVKKTRHSVY
jgi:hypothetical protein